MTDKITDERLGVIIDALRETADAISRSLGFWPSYTAPTKLAEAIQMPLANPNWQTRVLNAYAQTKGQKP